MTLTTYNDIKCCLDVCEAMIDRLQRELYSNGSMMGAINSAYESLTEDEKIVYKAKREQLNNLLKYKTELLDYALEVIAEENNPTQPTKIDIVEYTTTSGTTNNFSFSI